MNDILNDFDETIIRNYNGLYLSKSEIEVLKRYGIDYSKHNMKSLIYEIEEIIEEIENPDELEELSINLSERNYYYNTNK